MPGNRLPRMAFDARTLAEHEATAHSLTDDARIGGVPVNAREDALAERVCRLRISRDCGEVLGMSAGQHFGVGVSVFHKYLTCRPSRLLSTLMPSLDC